MVIRKYILIENNNLIGKIYLLIFCIEQGQLYFTDTWEQRKLGEVLKVNSGKDYKHLNTGNIPVYGTGGYMLSVDESLSEVDAIGIGRKGTIDKPQLLSAPFWTVDTLFFMTPLQSNVLLFLYALSQNIEWAKMDESTGVPSLSKMNIENVDVNISEPDEQAAIGTFFRTLDDIIALHQRKLDGLKELKQGYLQQMLPQAGECVPRVRFAGFDAVWEARKLGEVADIVGGGTPDTTNPDYWDGVIDWYSPVEIGEQIHVNGSKKKITTLGLQKSSAKVLPIGTVLFTSRAGIGNTAILSKEGATNQGFQSIVPYNNELDTYFIYSRSCELKRYGETNGAGSTFVEVSGKQMSQMPIFIPTLTEQIAIGNFFRNIDEQIIAQQNRLKQLKQLKSAYLQKMFV